MATWADVVAKQNELIRKALDAEVFLAPPSVEVPTSIVDTTDGTSPLLPTGFMPLGNHTDDGLTWGREVENSDITSHGSVEPTRSDIRQITSTLAIQAQETRRQVFEAYYSVDLSAITPATSGEVTFDEPTRPKSRYYRLLGISVDDGDAGEIYLGRLFARAKVTEMDEETWTDGDDAMVRGMTFQAYKDATAGFSVRHFFGGPGWRALLEDMGFPAAPAGV